MIADLRGFSGLFFPLRFSCRRNALRIHFFSLNLFFHAALHLLDSFPAVPHIFFGKASRQVPVTLIPFIHPFLLFLLYFTAVEFKTKVAYAASFVNFFQTII